MAMQDRAVRTRRALVQAAAEVFAREGFVQASLTSISRTAGVSTGALHFHFESKLELALAVEGEACRILREQICGQGGDPDGSRCTHPLQRLIEATHLLLLRLRDDPVVRAGFGLGARGALGPDGGAGLRGQWRRWVEEVLDEAGRRGELAEGVVGADAALAVVAATVGFEAMSVGAPEWLDPATADRFWGVMLPRLAAPPILDRNRRHPANRGALVPADPAAGL
ncbi:TetR family transcriptional regulator [Streptomyces sp. NBC_00090]|uniref:ScbR family autoregulator-binding transcription factor n=1 Tax=Streptomyces sp. NBC_00090 TaxID=2903619 RepID=UPI00324D1063